MEGIGIWGRLIVKPKDLYIGSPERVFAAASFSYCFVPYASLDEQALNGLLQGLNLALELAALIGGDGARDNLGKGSSEKFRSHFLSHARYLLQGARGFCLPGGTHRRRGREQPWREQIRMGRSAKRERRCLTLGSSFAIWLLLRWDARL